MNTGLILGQYKVIRLLHREDGYAAVQAVDILERSKPVRLLNIYENEAARNAACVFHELRDFDDFLGVRCEKGTLIAVFRWTDLPGIDSVFFGGSKQPEVERLHYLEALFRLALRYYQLPPELGCAALRNRNLRVSTGDRRLKSNYLMAPSREAVSPRELVCLAGDQARKIIMPSADTVYPLRKFLMELEGGRWEDVFALNCAWNDAEKDIRAAREEKEKAGLFGNLWITVRDDVKFARENRRSVYGNRQ